MIKEFKNPFFLFESVGILFLQVLVILWFSGNTLAVIRVFRLKCSFLIVYSGKSMQSITHVLTPPEKKCALNNRS